MWPGSKSYFCYSPSNPDLKFLTCEMDIIANDNLLDTAHSDVPYETEKTSGHIDQRAALVPDGRKVYSEANINEHG